MAALARPKPNSRSRRRSTGLWFERGMALLALVNLGLVVFDLSYVRFRDNYLRLVPGLTHWYGETFKGMEPERTTVQYLATVDNLEKAVQQRGLDSPEARAILQDLQQQSMVLIDEDPFQQANKSGTLERIKHKMRDRMNQDSAKIAFQLFWSSVHLAQAGIAEELAFFNTEITPLMETNYYRGIAFDSGPIDRFWQIDLWFIGIFTLELLARSFVLSRRYANIRWIDAVLWRWYDLLLVIPFSALQIPMMAVGRIIPVATRLNQARVIDLEPVRNRVNRFLISQVAIELTEVVVVQIIEQIQRLIRSGEAARWILEAGSRYVDINGVNELQVIGQRLASMLVDEVLPQVKPEVDALLDHSMTQALDLAPGYQNFRQLPGVSPLTEQITRQVASQVSQILYDTLRQVLADERGAELLQSLLTNVSANWRSQLKEHEETLQEIQAMTATLLEEVKLSYVKRLAAEDNETLAEQRYRLYDVTQSGQSSKERIK